MEMQERFFIKYSYRLHCLRLLRVQVTNSLVIMIKIVIQHLFLRIL